MAAHVVTQLRHRSIEEKTTRAPALQTGASKPLPLLDRPGEAQTIPWWAALAAALAPVLLIGGFFFAAALQPASYSPVHDTISALAAQGATDAWLMTGALVGLAICYMLCALGLRSARPAGRVILAGGGVATLLIAVFRQPRHGYSFSHELAVIVAAVTMCAWPVFAAGRVYRSPLLTRTPSFIAVAVLSGIALWYAAESHSSDLGIAERCAAAAPALWLTVVVLTTWRALSPAARHEYVAEESPFVLEQAEAPSSSLT